MTDTEKHNTALTDLVQLPDGNWIDPAAITQIQHLPPSNFTGREYPDSVQILVGCVAVAVLKFDDAIKAAEFRDELAGKANAAKEATRAALKSKA